MSIIVKDNVKKVLDSLRGLSGYQVLVGIPEANDGRLDGQITNAELGYIHEFGAPGANIPARPHLVPGIRKATPEALVYLRKAVNAAVDRDPQKMMQAMNRAGLIAVASVKREITTGNFIALKPASVVARARARGSSRMRESEKEYVALIRLGATPPSAQSAAGIQALINTGQLRNAYTYVIRRV